MRRCLPLSVVLLLGTLATAPGCQLDDPRPDAPTRLPTAPGPWLPGQAERDDPHPHAGPSR